MPSAGAVQTQVYLSDSKVSKQNIYLKPVTSSLITDNLDPSKELLIHQIDRLAALTPDASFCEYPNHNEDHGNGFDKVTYGMLANAINGLTWWLLRSIGPGQNIPTLAYVGPNDLRYAALTFAAVKAGYVVSKRSGGYAQERLFELHKCEILLTGYQEVSFKGTSLNMVAPRLIEVPSVKELVSSVHEIYLSSKTLGNSWTEPLVSLQTSGSTGLPKLITWTHGFASSFIRQMQLKAPPGCKSQLRVSTRKRMFLNFPPYNGAHLIHTLIMTIAQGTIVISPVSTHTPTLPNLISGLQHTKATIAFVPPCIISDLARDSSALAFVSSQLQLILFCGGSVPTPLGDKVAASIRLVRQYGVSEMSQMAVIRHRDDDGYASRQPHPINTLHAHTQQLLNKNWQYIRLQPNNSSHFIPYWNDLYELVMIRDEDQILEIPRSAVAKNETSLHPVFHFLPDAKKYHTRDLFSPHPTITGLWRKRARVDDLFMLRSGQIVNPIDYEHTVQALDADITAVLMVGQKRAQVGLLVELEVDEDMRSVDGQNDFDEQVQEAVLLKLLTAVEIANKEVPGYMRVEKQCIHITERTKPMYRAGKGTVQRQLTLQNYGTELDAMFEKSDT